MKEDAEMLLPRSAGNSDPRKTPLRLSSGVFSGGEFTDVKPTDFLLVCFRGGLIQTREP